jgi:glycosyltransferase involved in cell wall biosynthesis
MLVSIIIPVYNAERYIREAVESALAQPETGEVILIEDASPDNSLQVCRDLACEFAKVRLLRHSDGKNHGPGASRNLGIRNAKFDHIAFLDADDFFLPDRFSIAKQIFEANPQVEGVYEAVGVHFENEAAERRWQEKHSTMLTTMRERVSPEHLFEAQGPVGNCGYCPTGGWVVKRSVLDKTGLFDEHLRLHQDTAMYVKLAAVGRMVPGRLDVPVAKRRLHDHNRISAPRPPVEVYRDRVLMWGALWRWGKRNVEEGHRHILLDRFIKYAARPYTNRAVSLRSRCQSLSQLTCLLWQYPDLSFERLFWRKYTVTVKRVGWEVMEVVKSSVRRSI